MTPLILKYAWLIWSLLFPYPQQYVFAGFNKGATGGNTYTLSTENLLSGCGSAMTCGPTQTVTAGKTAVIVMSDGSATLSAVTGGGTWVVPASCASTSSQWVSCAYNLSTSSASSLTLTFNTTTGSPQIFYWEYGVSPGPAVFDGAAFGQQTGSAGAVTGPTASSLTGTKDTCLSVAGNNISSSSVNAPWGNWHTGTTADLENQAPSGGSITGATFNGTLFGSVGMNTVCLK